MRFQVDDSALTVATPGTLPLLIVPNATVTVYVAGTGTPGVADGTPYGDPIYGVPSGGAGIGNPFVTDSSGNVLFYIDTGEALKVAITGTGMGTVVKDYVYPKPDPAAVITASSTLWDSGQILKDAGNSLAADGMPLRNGAWGGGTRFDLSAIISGTQNAATPIPAAFTHLVKDTSKYIPSGSGTDTSEAAGLVSTFSVQTLYPSLGSTASSTNNNPQAAYHALFYAESNAARRTAWDMNAMVGLAWVTADANARARGMVAEANVSSTSANSYAIGLEVYARNWRGDPTSVLWTGAAGQSFAYKTVAVVAEGGGALSASGVPTIIPGSTTLRTAISSAVQTSLAVDNTAGATQTAREANFPVSTGTTPSPNPMYVTIYDGTNQEVVALSAIDHTTNTWTISARGLFGTTAQAAFAIGSVVERFIPISAMYVGYAGIPKDAALRGLVLSKYAVAPGGVGIDLGQMTLGGNQVPLILPNNGFINGQPATPTDYGVKMIGLNSSDQLSLRNGSRITLQNATASATYGYFDGTGLTVTGVVAASGAVSGTTGTFSNGLNVGSASGAGTGVIRASSTIRSGGKVYGGGQEVMYYNVPSAQANLADNADLTLGALQGVVLVHNFSAAQFRMVASLGGVSVSDGFGTAGFGTIGTDPGDTGINSGLAIICSGGNLIVRNRTGATQSVGVQMLGAG